MWWPWDGFGSDVQSHVIIPACPSRERGQTFSGLEHHLRWILGFKSGGVLSLDSSGNETAQLVSICTCSCCYVFCGQVIRRKLLLQHGKIPGAWLSCSNCRYVIGKSQLPFLKWLVISMTKYFYLYIPEMHWVKLLYVTISKWLCENCSGKGPLQPVVLWREVRYAALPTQGKTISLTALRAVSINRYTHWHTKCFLLTKATFCHDVWGLCCVTEQHNLNTSPFLQRNYFFMDTVKAT